MPGKHLLIETESGDGDGEGSEPDTKGTESMGHQRAESGSLLLFSLKQLSGSDVRMTNRGFGCLGKLCNPDFYRKER